MVLIHLNSGRSRGLSAPTTFGMWTQPASMTAAKQPRPSLVTVAVDRRAFRDWVDSDDDATGSRGEPIEAGF